MDGAVAAHDDRQFSRLHHFLRWEPWEGSQTLPRCGSGGRRGRARSARGGQGGLSVPKPPQGEPAFADAIMGTLGGFASPFGPPPAASSPLASLGLAKPSRTLAPAGDEGAREARGVGRVGCPSRSPHKGSPPSPTRSWEPCNPPRVPMPAFADAIMGTLGGFASPFGPPPAASSPLASLGLAKPSRAVAPAGNEGAREARGLGRVGCPSRSPRRGSPPSPTRSWEP